MEVKDDYFLYSFGRCQIMPHADRFPQGVVGKGFALTTSEDPADMTSQFHEESHEGRLGGLGRTTRA
jgi:hypothetical protein